MQISGKGLHIATKEDYSKFESGELQASCRISPIFGEGSPITIESKGYLPLRLEVDTTLWDGSVQVNCAMLSTDTNTSVLSKPLGIVLTPATTEVEVVILYVCFKKEVNIKLFRLLY